MKPRRVYGKSDKAIIESVKASSNPVLLMKKFAELIPDVNNPDMLIRKIEDGNTIVWLEGWVDSCLSGTGFPLMEEGGFERKQQYIRDVTPRQMRKCARERKAKLVCSGVVPLDDKSFLYGVSWAVMIRKPQQAEKN